MDTSTKHSGKGNNKHRQNEMKNSIKLSTQQIENNRMED